MTVSAIFQLSPLPARTTQLSSDPSRKIQKKNEIQFFAIIAKGKYKNPFEVTYVKRGRQRGAGQGRSQRGGSPASRAGQRGAGLHFFEVVVDI